MTTSHSKNTVVIIDDNDVSAFCKDSNASRKSGTEDNTTYGKDDMVKDPTLRDGAFACSGVYHTLATSGSPKSVLEPLVGTKVTVKYRPEGTGTGLPQNSFDCVITDYTETAPVGGYRQWSLTGEPSDAWDNTVQS